MKVRRIAVASMGLVLCTGSLTTSALADTIRFEAVNDFPIIDAGEVPYYSESPNRAALAINAAREDNRNKFARATLQYEGASDFYDITLTGLAELDGEAVYQVLIDDVLVGTATNPEVDVDYTPIRHTFDNIMVPNGATIAVESLANTNGKIPEGDTTAYARGRWTSLELDNGDAQAASGETVDLSLSASLSGEQIEVGDIFSITLDISNSESSAVATGPRLALTHPPAAVVLASASPLACVESGNDIICELSEIAAGNATQVTVSLEARATSPSALLRATITTDQPEADPEDNVVTLPLSIVDRQIPGETVTPDTGTTEGDDSNTEDSLTTENESENIEQVDNSIVESTTGSSSGGGSLSAWFAFLLALANVGMHRIRYSPTRASGCDRCQ